MDSLWDGDVPIDTEAQGGRNVILHGLTISHLAKRNEGSESLHSGADLRFRAFVETDCVPFGLLHGPRLAVYTEDPATEEKLWDMLVADQVLSQHDEDASAINALDNEASRRNAAAQSFFESDVSILLEVGNPCSDAVEVLLYAATPAQDPLDRASVAGLMTPPRSSSPTLPQDTSDSRSRDLPIQIFAQPLRSISSLSQFLHAPPSPPSPSEPNHGTFLPLDEARQPSSPPRKRPKLETVFSAATSATRQARRAGGKSVSQMMARPRTLSGASTGSGLSRSYTTGSLPALASKNGSSRPTSRAGSVSGPFVSSRGTSLHRVAAALPALQTRSASEAASFDVDDAPLSAPPLSAVPPPSAPLPDDHASTPRPDDDPDDDVARANKAALSRVVLAALRMWGHAPPPKAQRRAAPTEKAVDETDRETATAFKPLYHATYSAARFALRRDLRAAPVPGEAMRRVVEQVLGIFLGEVDGGGGDDETKDEMVV